MLLIIIVILAVLWFLGYMPITGVSVPNITFFSLNNQAITLWNILILLVALWAIGLLPGEMQTIASVLLLLWVLSELGILAIVGLPSIVVIIIIIALVFVLFRNK